MSPENMKLYTFRCRPTLMGEFSQVCEARNETVSESLRDFMKDRVRRNRRLLDERSDQREPEVSGRRGTPEPPTGATVEQHPPE